MPDLSIDLRIEQDHQIVAATGDVDLASASSLESGLAGALGRGPTIADLTGVAFMDSTGLRVLLAAHEQAAENGRRLKIIVEEGPVTKLLSITGVDSHLDTYSSVADALADA